MPTITGKKGGVTLHVSFAGIMSAEVDSGKNFRSAYYGSLGFREEEKVINQLDTLLKEEPIGKCNYRIMQ